MYSQNCWYVVADNDEVKPTEILSRKVAGIDLVLYRNDANKVIAMDDKCCHR